MGFDPTGIRVSRSLASPTYRCSQAGFSRRWPTLRTQSRQARDSRDAARLGLHNRRLSDDNRPMAVRRRRRRALPSVPDLRKIRDEEPPAAPEQPTIIEMIRHYLDWKSGRASENTISTYTSGLRLFSQWLILGGVDPVTDTADALPGSVMDEYIVWMRRRRSIRTGQPISASSVALYHAAVVGLFKYAARRGWLPARFNWVEMKASAAETLGKIPTRPAQFDRRIPLLVAYVDQLSLPHAHLRKGRAHLELLRDRR
jgi:Phage integrase, N-terminal SAM-like domain